MNNEKETTQTLEIFNGNKEPKFHSRSYYEKETHKAAPQSTNASTSPTTDTSTSEASPKQEGEKQSAVELMLYDLMERYAFINIGNRHLYYYHEKEGYWKLIPANLVDVELRVMLTTRWIKSINSSSLGELYKWLLITTDTKDNSIFNTGLDYLNFKDRAYNWKTKETTKDRKYLYFSYALAVDYPKDQKPTGAWDSFLDDVFDDDKKTRKEFSKFVGLALSDIRNLKYIIHLYGQSNTGKSTALNAIKNVVGANVCASLSFSQLSQEFYLSSLHGCRLNISGEISGVSTAKLDVLKSLSGNDSVVASHKFKDGFVFDNRCLLAFSSNELPQVSFMEMQSYMSRAIIFPFRNVIDRKNWSLDFEANLHADIAGIVEFAIEGLERLANDNYVIHETSAMKGCKREYTGRIDSFTLFCDKYVKVDTNGFTPSAQINKAYQAFCLEHEYEALQTNQWPQVLKRQFLCKPHTKPISVEDGGPSKLSRGYKGIVLDDEVAELFNATKNVEAVFANTIMQ